MSTEKAAVESIENASSEASRCPNEAQIHGFDGLSDDELKRLEKRCMCDLASFGNLSLICRAVVRKIDLHLITSLFGIFIFNILDRSNIASARLGGLQKDLNLTDTQYQTAVSIMVCYLVLETLREETG
jgi:hypothetical protein